MTEMALSSSNGSEKGTRGWRISSEIVVVVVVEVVVILEQERKVLQDSYWFTRVGRHPVGQNPPRQKTGKATKI